MKELKKYYKNALFIPTLFVVVFQIIWQIIEYDPDYESEWISSGLMSAWAIVIIIINSLVISILSLTIFFNNKLKIRNNLILSLLTWFLFPMIWLGYSLGRGLILIIQTNSIDSNTFFILLNTVPFVVGLIWSFIKYRKTLEIKENE